MLRILPIGALIIGCSLLPCAEAFGQVALPFFISPALPSSLDPLTLHTSVFCGVQVSPPVVSGNTITVQVMELVPPPPCPPASTPLQFPLPPLSPGSYTVQQVINGMLSPQTFVFQVGQPATSFVLLDGHFEVTVQWLFPHQGPAGTPALLTAYAVQLSDQAGYFYFFNGVNPELMIKILDGRMVNGHYWVFIASMTDVPSMVTVTDFESPVPNCGFTAACITKTYSNAAGVNQNFIDINYWADFP